MRVDLIIQPHLSAEEFVELGTLAESVGISGVWVEQLAVPVTAGDHAWPVPASLGAEVAVSIRQVPTTPVESHSWGGTKARFRAQRD